MQLYHGTRRGFTPGGWLMPRSWHGGPGTSAPANGTLPDSDQYIYVTTDLDLAWVYAWHAPGGGRPKVLIIEPTRPVEHDPEHSLRMPAYRSQGMARVAAVLTTPTITEDDAREGWQTDVDAPHLPPPSPATVAERAPRATDNCMSAAIQW